MRPSGCRAAARSAAGPARPCHRRPAGPTSPPADGAAARASAAPPRSRRAPCRNGAAARPGRGPRRSAAQLVDGIGAEHDQRADARPLCIASSRSAALPGPDRPIVEERAQIAQRRAEFARSAPSTRAGDRPAGRAPAAPPRGPRICRSRRAARPMRSSSPSAPPRSSADSTAVISRGRPPRGGRPADRSASATARRRSCGSSAPRPLGPAPALGEGQLRRPRPERIGAKRHHRVEAAKVRPQLHRLAGAREHGQFRRDREVREEPQRGPRLASARNCRASVGEPIGAGQQRDPVAVARQSAAAPLPAGPSSTPLRRAGRAAERDGSNSDRISASAKISVPPRLAGWSGLPWILVGRPSWLSTITPAPGAAQRQRGGEEQRLARHHAFRHGAIGHDRSAGGLQPATSAPPRWRRASGHRGGCGGLSAAIGPSVADRAVGQVARVDLVMGQQAAGSPPVCGSSSRLERAEDLGPCGDRFGPGSSWQERHHPIVSGCACRISGMVPTSPWQ